MKPNKLVVAMALAGIAGITNPALADPSKEQTRSAVSGMVIGAVAAGPVGAFTGAILGGEVIGRLLEHRRVNRELNVQLADLTTELDSARSRHILQDHVIAALNQDLDKVLAIQSTTARSRQLPVQFRTSSDDLEPQYKAELEQIANVLQRNKDATVTLAGFADRRGDDDFNQALSEKRVRSIKQFLMSRGVSSKQVIGLAFGETQPLTSTESLESNFFDRRVVVELNMDIDRELATR